MRCRLGHHAPDRHAGFAEGMFGIWICLVPVCLGTVRELHQRLSRCPASNQHTLVLHVVAVAVVVSTSGLYAPLVFAY